MGLVESEHCPHSRCDFGRQRRLHDGSPERHRRRFVGRGQLELMQLGLKDPLDRRNRARDLQRRRGHLLNSEAAAA